MAGAPAKLLRAHAAPAPGTIVAGQVDSVGASSITLKKKDGGLLRFGIVTRPHMCWCFPEWVGYTLASPKK